MKTLPHTPPSVLAQKNHHLFFPIQARSTHQFQFVVHGQGVHVLLHSPQSNKSRETLNMITTNLLRHQAIIEVIINYFMLLKSPSSLHHDPSCHFDPLDFNACASQILEHDQDDISDCEFATLIWGCVPDTCSETHYDTLFGTMSRLKMVDFVKSCWPTHRFVRHVLLPEEEQGCSEKLAQSFQCYQSELDSLRMEYPGMKSPARTEAVNRAACRFVENISTDCNNLLCNQRVQDAVQERQALSAYVVTLLPDFNVDQCPSSS